MKRTLSPYLTRIVLIIIAFVMVLFSALFSTHLAARLRSEEQKRMEIWAEATRRLITAQPNEELDFYLNIIENNTTIPVYMTNADGECILSRNVPEGADIQRKADKLRESQEPIEVRVGRGVVQYIYYEESSLLTLLTWFPYINLAVVLLFMAVALLFVFTMQEAEQDRVWAGLSKETAHQLGTPISSLNAWQEILRSTYPDDKLIPEMDADLRRLTTIADRFSKVGSMPELTPTDLSAVLNDTVDYMRKRTSGRVEIDLDISRLSPPKGESEKVLALANPALLSWVIENLLRNAVDAMDGSGRITITLSGSSNRLCIDISDTGKGIPRRDWHRVFMPGYTTKERGWGMGLSLSRRIINTYHHGRITVLRSSTSAPTGTTFRIELNGAR
ncbi:MAG: HAMP domain-containing histidine kinase [Bacteroidales bacterium]|jgi:signal transduction histidine kinase|nr:HAMP domain-containing histidine kinase [Bacteroidales bacterium]